MNMSDASAMTEASGLTDEHGGYTKSDTGMGPDQRLLRISEWIRTIAVTAPLSSLFVAFLLGVMVARRR